MAPGTVRFRAAEWPALDGANQEDELFIDIKKP
jgi:hypothetical protein